MCRSLGLSAARWAGYSNKDSTVKTWVSFVGFTVFLVMAQWGAPDSASAEIALGGEARMGLRYESGKTSVAAGTRITARASGVTDGGVEFGAVINLDQTGTGMAPVFRGDPPQVQVYISGDNHSLRIGQGVKNAVQSLAD
jgi:hypothetical protein